VFGGNMAIAIERVTIAVGTSGKARVTVSDIA
jgi:hypothetical protein